MATLTEQGLMIRRYPAILDSIIEKMRKEISNDLQFDDDLLLGQITKIIARELALLEEMLLLLNDSWDKDKAEGEALDRLMALVGLMRIQAEKTSGDVIFKVREGVSISINTKMRNTTTKDMYTSTESVTANIGSCQRVELLFDSPSEGDIYSVTINNHSLTYTAELNDSVEDVVNGFTNSINNLDSSFKAELITEGENSLLAVYTTDRDDISISLVDKTSVEAVFVRVPVEAEEFGAIHAPPFSVTTLLSGVGGVDAIYNERAFGVGRLKESDTEFKLRAKGSLSVRGKSTYDAVLTAIKAIPFASNVLLIENASGNTVDEIPPYSFEVVLDAPDTEEHNQEIAKVIWENKPLGITAYGKISPPIEVLDVGGNSRKISFTRPSDVWIGVQVEYSLYDEEVLTPNLAEVIRNSVMDYMSRMLTGVDVIPRRFIGGIYDSTTGVGSVIVKTKILGGESSQLSEDEAGLSDSAIPISNRQRAALKVNNIILKEV